MISILPLYYLVILYYFITENVLNHFTPVIPTDDLGVGWFRYIFLLNGFLNGNSYFWNNLGITWTIPVFMFFYLIAPWILRKVKTIFSAVAVWLTVFITTQALREFYDCVIFKNLHVLFLGVVVYRACGAGCCNVYFGFNCRIHIGKNKLCLFRAFLLYYFGSIGALYYPLT